MTTIGWRRSRWAPYPGARWFLPLITASGVVMSLTAPLEVLFVTEFSESSWYIAVFMLSAAVGVIVIDVFGTRFVPNLAARAGLAVGLGLFGLASIGMGTASGDMLLMTFRVMQGVGGGMVLGAGLQAAVRVHPAIEDLPRSLGKFNAAILLGGALGSPGGLLIAGLVDGWAGYQVAFVATGVIAVLVAAGLVVALPKLAAPPGLPRPRISLPRFGKSPGCWAALVLATSGDFLRGGVVFTALPLTGAVRGYQTVTITAAIALLSGIEIAVLLITHRLLHRFGVITVLVVALGLGALCAALLTITSTVPIYLSVSVLLGISLAGTTAALPVMVVAQVGESSAGLAKFRISSGVGVTAGMAGCAVLGTEVGTGLLFAVVAVALSASAALAWYVGMRVAMT